MVCGCSFSALPVKEEHKGTHFSEILADRLGWDLVNNAYQGCSNGGVRLQIEEVIRQKPNFAIIIPSFFDRTEIPITGLRPDFKNLSWLEFDRFMKTYTGYDEDKGIDNINYANCDNPALVCENFVSLVNNWAHVYRRNEPLSPEVINAVKEYVTYLYDASWKKQQDRWIIEHGMLELIHNNIPFVMIPTLSLWRFHDKKPRMLGEKYYVMDQSYCPLNISQMAEYDVSANEWKNDPGYHTNYAGQIYLADKYQELMKERWNLC